LFFTFLIKKGMKYQTIFFARDSCLALTDLCMLTLLSVPWKQPRHTVLVLGGLFPVILKAYKYV